MEWLYSLTPSLQFRVSYELKLSKRSLLTEATACLSYILRDIRTFISIFYSQEHSLLWATIYHMLYISNITAVNLSGIVMGSFCLIFLFFFCSMLLVQVISSSSYLITGYLYKWGLSEQRNMQGTVSPDQDRTTSWWVRWSQSIFSFIKVM